VREHGGEEWGCSSISFLASYDVGRSRIIIDATWEVRTSKYEEGVGGSSQAGVLVCAFFCLVGGKSLGGCPGC
jgi:hypothetical protein